jgi:hypothetical protein
VEKEIQMALGQNDSELRRFEHIRELNQAILSIRRQKAWDLSILYSMRKSRLDHLLENKPRFDLIARFYYRKNLAEARRRLAETEREAEALGFSIPKEGV